MTLVGVLTLILVAEAAIGALLSLFDVQDTGHERELLQRSHRQSGTLWITAHGNYRTAILTLGMFSGFLAAMASALLLDPGDLRVLIGRTGILVAMTLLMTKRIIDRWDRRRIRRLQLLDVIEVLPGSDLAIVGGPMGMQQIVAGWYARLLREDSIRAHFQHVSIVRLIGSQAEYLTKRLADRPTGIDLRVAHAHLKITADTFDRSLVMLRETLSDFHVPADVCERLSAIVADTRDQIVTRQPS